MKIKLISKNAPTYKSGSSRAKWYAAIKRYNGKDLDAFLAAVEKKPPALKKNGEAEPARGWVRYFVREEIVELKD